MRRRHLALAATLLALAGDAHSQTPARQPLLVLDAGHNPEEPGARSLHGVDELFYNDRFVAELAPALRAAGWRVRLTRIPGQSLALAQRPAMANAWQADLFLSIHHDSAREAVLREVETPAGPSYETRMPIRGYSLFVSGENRRFADSRHFAELLGAQMLALGRPPTLHHADPVAGAGRPLLNAQTGIYQYDRLAVLRHAHMPAVLLELGVIVDAVDEAYVNNPANRRAMVQAIVRAVRQYADEALRR